MKLVKSSLLVKLVILILVVYATVTLVSLRKQITEKNEQEAILNSSIAATQQENNRIQDSTDAGVEAVARDKLGMVDEGDIVFYDVGE
jgi:cell division protein FtsB